MLNLKKKDCYSEFIAVGIEEKNNVGNDKCNKSVIIEKEVQNGNCLYYE